jgi:hypothetical protein
MKNQFAEEMAKRTDSELDNILNSQPGDYKSEALEAAKQEMNKRTIIRDKFSKYSDEQIVEILISTTEFHPFEVEVANEEAERRNLHFKIEKEKMEKEINKEIQNLKSDIVKERYPVLEFISKLYKILAWLIGITAVIAFFCLLSKGQSSMYIGIGVLIGGGILFVTFIAIAEGIKVFIDIENNTRITASNSGK